MSTTTMTDTAPRVWIACLSCYNDGRLVGDWFDAEIADDVTLGEVHAEFRGERMGCEEMWVFDHKGLPICGEYSPADAAEWGRLLAEVDDWQRDALMAWVRSGDYVMEADGPMPSLPDFEERYAGEWSSFREYAEQLADDIGLLSGMPDELACYFDWSAWTRDLAHDYTTEPAADGGVFVFRSL